MVLKAERRNKPGVWKVITFADGQTYRFNKWVFRAAVLGMVLVFFLAWVENGHLDPRTRNIYLKCDNRGLPCGNPFYKEFDYKDVLPYEILILENLPPGFVYGRPPGFFQTHFGLAAFLLVVLAFLVNHLLYNKNVKFRRGMIDLNK